MNSRRTFLHISDLHLGYTAWPGYRGREDGRPDSDALKARCLAEIACAVHEMSPDFVFVTGDIAECHPLNGEARHVDRVLPVVDAAFAPLRKACLRSGSELIAITGDHDPSVEILRLALPEVRAGGDTMVIRGTSVGCFGCGPKRAGWNEAVEGVCSARERIDIALVHDSDRATSPVFKELHTSYIGCGHLHTPSRTYRPDGIVVGRPGHLYSYWDGNGKAWPTGFLVGSIEPGILDGKPPVELEFRIFASVPRTLRLQYDDDRLFIRGVLPNEARRLGMDEAVRGEPAGLGGWCDGSLLCGAEAARELAVSAIRDRANDIFVSPAVRSGRRLVRYGNELLADEALLDEMLRLCGLP